MISIRHAALDERKKTYEWYCNIAEQDNEKKWTVGQEYTWEEYVEDFEDYYFEKSGRKRGAVMIIEEDGEEIGCMCYSCFHLKPSAAELDIWMRDEKYCEKGRGTKAIELLIEYLKKEQDMKKFLIRPAGRNLRAIRAYEKAEFRHVKDKKAAIDAYLLEEYKEVYGDGDYGFENTAVMVLE